MGIVPLRGEQDHVDQPVRHISHQLAIILIAIACQLLVLSAGVILVATNALDRDPPAPSAMTKPRRGRPSPRPAQSRPAARRIFVTGPGPEPAAGANLPVAGPAASQLPSPAPSAEPSPSPTCILNLPMLHCIKQRQTAA